MADVRFWVEKETAKVAAAAAGVGAGAAQAERLAPARFELVAGFPPRSIERGGAGAGTGADAGAARGGGGEEGGGRTLAEAGLLNAAVTQQLMAPLPPPPLPGQGQGPE